MFAFKKHIISNIVLLHNILIKQFLYDGLF